MITHRFASTLCRNRWSFMLVLMALALSSFAIPAQAGITAKPQLQIELGGHAAAIRRIDVAPSRDLVVTVSDDKTARVWKLSTRQLQHVLRPSSGPNAVGRLYGVAIHPSDDIVAVAGSTAAKGGGHKILMFSVSSGQLLRSFDARAGDVKKLAWTPDGKLLLATYAGQSGFRAFDPMGLMVFEQNFAAVSYGLAVSKSGAVAVTTMDGIVHFYQGADGQISSNGELALSGRMPVGAAFSPDGRHLAVGFFGSRANSDGPQIIEMGNRQVLRKFKLPSLAAGNLMTVAWTPDGRGVVASGTGYDKNIRFSGYVFDAATGKVTASHVLANDSIQDMRASSHSQMVYASFSGSWGTLDLTTGKSLTTGAQLARIRGAESLRISADGRQVGIRFDTDQSVGWFDLDKRLLTMGVIPKKLVPPKQPSGVFADTRKPTLNGYSIKLASDEVGRAAAQFNTSGSVVFGSSKALSRLAADGSVDWRVPTATEVRAVNVSADDQFVVSAKADGTINWRKASDGQLLLTGLVRQDGKWVVWTPDGQFDASAGADRLVGWSVNRLNDSSADFFSLNRFRDSLNQPGVIDNVLGEPPNTAAIIAPTVPAAAVVAKIPAQQTVDSIQFPPVISAVNLTGLRPEGKLATIPFVIRAQGQPEIEVRVDGRPAPDANVTLPEQFDGKSRAIATVQMPQPGSVIQLIARDKFGTSEPLGIRVDQLPAAAPEQTVTLFPPVESALTTDPTTPIVALVDKRKKDLAEAIAALPSAKPLVAKGPKLYVLSIGISKYQDPKYELGLAAKDSRDFMAAVRNQKGRLYTDVIARSLTDQTATREGIVDGLQWLSSQVGPEDVGMLFIAGHGVNAPDGQYYFMPFEGDHRALAETSVPERVIRETLGRMRGKALFFVDTCFAGNALGNMQSVSRELARMANNLASAENGVVVFASSSGRQLSEENEAWGNGAFTKAVIAGLNGQADLTKTGRITFKGLDFFISEEVSKLTEGRQTPVTISPIGVPDFAIARLTAI